LLLKGGWAMNCYPNGYACAGAATQAQECDNNNSCGNNSTWSCIINLIIILIVLQFLTQLLCNNSCDSCC